MPESEPAPSWEVVGYVIASQYRVGVLASLVESGAAPPSRLADRTGYPISHVSGALGELRRAEGNALVKLLVAEERKKGRVYGATDRGERVVAAIRENEMADGGSDDE